MEVRSLPHTPTHIDLLPSCTFQNILSYIPDFAPLFLVSRKWNAATDEQIATRILYREVSYFKKDPFDLSKLFDLFSMREELFIYNKEIRLSLIDHKIFYQIVHFFADTDDIEILNVLGEEKIEFLIDLLIAKKCPFQAKLLLFLLIKMNSKNFKKYFLKVKVQEIIHYFKNSKWKSAKYEIKNLSVYFPNKAKKLTVERKDLKTNRIDLLPNEIFHHILSFIPELLPVSLVSKSWNLSVQEQLTLRFPEKKRNTLECVSILGECQFFKAAENFYDKITFPETKFKIFKEALTGNNFVHIFRSFEQSVRLQYSEFQRPINFNSYINYQEFKYVYKNFINNFAKNLNYLAFYLKKFNEEQQLLKTFCQCFYWPLLKKLCEKKNYSYAVETFQLLKNSPNKKAIWEYFPKNNNINQYLLEDHETAMKFIAMISHNSLKNEMVYSYICSINLSYPRINFLMNHFNSQAKPLETFRFAIEYSNFPILVKFLDRKGDYVPYFCGLLKKQDNDFLYNGFIKNIDINLACFKYYMSSNIYFPSDFYLYIFWPLVTKACLEDNCDIVSKLFSIIRTLESKYVIWNILFNNSNFSAITNSIFSISNSSLKLELLDYIIHFYKNLKQKSIDIINLFIITDHLKSMGEFDKAYQIELELFNAIPTLPLNNFDSLQILSTHQFIDLMDFIIKSDLKKNDEKFNLTTFYEKTLNLLYINDKNKDILLTKLNIKSDIFSLIIKQRISSLIKQYKFEEAKLFIYYIIEKFPSFKTKAETLLFNIKKMQSQHLNSLRIQQQKNEEILVAQSQHELSDEEDFFLQETFLDFSSSDESEKKTEN